MTASNRNLFLANGGVPSPQYYNALKDVYEALTGADGAHFIIQKGLIVKDFFYGSSNIVKNYDTNMRGFAISNDADIVNDNSNDLTFTIGGITFIVKPKESIDAIFDPFTSVSIVSNVPYRAVVRE